MELKLTTERSGQIGTVAVHGHLILMYGPRLHNEVKRLVREGCSRVLIDMSETSYVDSFGIGQMAACYETVQSNNGRIRFAGLSKKTFLLLQMCHLPNVLDFDTDYETSLAKLKFP